jgi:hypothetical protein
VDILFVGDSIFRGTQSHQAVLVDEDTQRIAAGDESVDSQVELESRFK